MNNNLWALYGIFMTYSEISHSYQNKLKITENTEKFEKFISNIKLH